MVALSKFSAVVDTTNEDTKVELTFADLRAKGDESADTKAFVVKSVVSGKLLIGTSAATAKAWAAGSNDVIKTGMNAYWTPATDANGAAVQAFKVVASTGTTASKTPVPVTVKVNAVNDAPTASNRSVTLNEDTTKKFAVTDFGFKDADAGNSLKSVTITTLETKGALKLNGVDVKLNQVIKVADIAAGKLTYAPVANANGTGYTSFGFKVSDGTANSASAYKMTLNVTAVNDAPTASNRSVTLNEDTTKKFAVTDFGFKDADAGNTLKSVTITTLETKGALKLNGVDVKLNQVISAADIAAGKLTYAPVANANGTGYTSFGFKVSDGTANSASAYKMTLNVTAVNDAPTASNRTLSATEDTARVLTVSDFGFADIDVGNTLKSVTITTLESKGTLKLNGVDVTLNQVIKVADITAGKLVYTPVANGNGTGYTSFGFKVSDGTASSASAYTATINVAAVNDAPTLTSFGTSVKTTNEDTAVSVSFAELTSKGNEADVDGSVTAFVVKAVSSGTLKIGTSAATATAWNATTNNTIDATKLAFWTPAANANGTLNAFTAVAKDSSGAVSTTAVQAKVTVTALNDAPTGSVTISGTALEGKTLTASNTLTDADGMSTVVYHWYANGTEISGQTGNTLTLAQDQVGKAITVKASYTDLQGTAESVTSAAATSKVVDNGITLTNFDQANLTALLDGNAQTVATDPTLSFDDSGFAFSNSTGEVDLVVALTSGDDNLTVTFNDVDLTVATTGTDIAATLPAQTVIATVNSNGIEHDVTLNNFALNEQIIGTAGDLATLTLQGASAAWDALIAQAKPGQSVTTLLETYYAAGATIALTMSDLKNDMGVSFHGDAVDSVTATAVIGVSGVEAHWSFA